jgi:hypothetical protein
MPSILDTWRRPYSSGPLTEAEFEQYWSQGYVVKQGCLQQQDLQPSLDAIDRLVLRSWQLKPLQQQQQYLQCQVAADCYPWHDRQLMSLQVNGCATFLSTCSLRESPPAIGDADCATATACSSLRYSLMRIKTTCSVDAAAPGVWVTWQPGYRLPASSMTPAAAWECLSA